MFLTVLPARARVRMSYSLTEVPAAHATLNLLGAAIQYQLNSTFAPGGGAGAHQPYMRDTFFAQYNKYKVHNVHITLTMPPTVNGNQSYLVCQVSPPNVTTTSNGVAIGSIRERPRSYMTTLSTANAVEWRKDIDVAAACNITKTEFEADTSVYAAAAGNDPTNKLLLIVNLACSSAASFATYMQTYMEFDVEWFERLQIATS